MATRRMAWMHTDARHKGMAAEVAACMVSHVCCSGMSRCRDEVKRHDGANGVVLMQKAGMIMALQHALHLRDMMNGNRHKMTDGKTTTRRYFTCDVTRRSERDDDGINVSVSHAYRSLTHGQDALSHRHAGRRILLTRRDAVANGRRRIANFARANAASLNAETAIRMRNADGT
ncbi:hypothetical protein NPIL_124491 [Nephila pilipes]|uniref:Uncharacterized protein n=1 Tax=Nephila pilipes TaxID=299642 RepID=A0A8X6PU59_NEPPI|nr:hypothetical protein NPIL_124491 [Nephila pilipes]